MSLILSAADIRRIADMMRLLATPGEHATVDEWRHHANESLKALLGADTAGFLLPGTGRHAMYSRDHDPDQLGLYPDIPVPDCADGTPIWESIVGIRAGPLAWAYGADYKSCYLESAYYNEYAGPNGAHDCLQLTTPTVDDESRASVASLQVWHSSPRGRKFGEREVSIAQLLFPAFEAGVRAQHRDSTGQPGMVHALDSLASSAALFDLKGREMHRTASLAALLEREAGSAASILLAIRATVDHLLAAPTSEEILVAPREKHSLRHVRTALDAYVVRGFIAQQQAQSARSMIVVSVEAERPQNDMEALSAQFGLTPSETRVARLLREGRSNADIASALGVSTHTIRRHTEAVFAKLGVRSRSEAAARLRP